jgi:hypothetical protein
VSSSSGRLTITNKRFFAAE